jgi:hypothetical protein
MRENNKKMAEEIAKIVWHPIRMSKWPEDHLIDEESESESDSNALNIHNISITSTIRTIKMSIRLRS